MDITKVVFPVYKLRSYLNIDTNPLGLVKITTIKGEYVLDDTVINGTFEERRLRLGSRYPNKRVYRLGDRVSYLRQLIKYKSGSKFIDSNGTIIRYTKSTSLFQVKSHKIINKRRSDNWTILSLENQEQSYLIGEQLTVDAKYASVMYTDWGPFLYDITSRQHEVYKRKL